MPRLRKTLPKPVPELLRAGEIEAARQLIQQCQPDARGGYAKQTPLMMTGCTPELAQWLIGRGTDLEARDQHGKTALHHSAQRRPGLPLSIDDLLRLGADVHARTNAGLTPLHAAANASNLEAVELLLAHGVDLHAVAEFPPHAALDAMLEQTSNARIPEVLSVVRVLLRAGAERTENTQGFVLEISKRFAFHRENFDPDSLETTESALHALCALFDVVPVGPRQRHDGTSRIVARAERWQDQHEELWTFLVPTSGPCQTVQGEVIRITGRLSHELLGNGGLNWDADYDQMCEHLLAHLAAGVPIDELQEARRLVDALPRGMEGTRRLAELATLWVARNPQPRELPPPPYDR
jgi:hypothetical protein